MEDKDQENDQIWEKLKKEQGAWEEYQEQLYELLKTKILHVGNSIPKYYFALREDLKDEKRFFPTHAHSTDTGYDVRAAMHDHKPLVLRPGQKALIPLGIRAFCPEGWWYELKSRSSTYTKKSLPCLIGTIDETFEGELCFACQYMPDVTCFGKDLVIEFGDALGQLIPKKRHEVEFLEASNEELNEMFANRAGSRGTGGWGSTGK